VKGSLLMTIVLAATAAEPRRVEFWRWFGANAERLSRLQPSRERALDDIQEAIHKVDSRLAFDIGIVNGVASELVVSADGNREVFPVVQQLVAAAPAVRGWKVTAFRPRGRPDAVVERKGVVLDARRIRFASRREGSKISLTIFVPRELGAAPQELLFEATLLLLDRVVGEYYVETKVGAIELALIAENALDPGGRPLVELPVVVDAVRPGAN